MVTVGGDDAVLVVEGLFHAYQNGLLAIIPAMQAHQSQLAACSQQQARYWGHGPYKWQKPRMYLALYIMSAAISMRRIRYMAVKNFSS